ncbi:SDK1, partial [Symbiodinium sp. KB8]
MKTALESLEKITLVEVRREGPDDQGAYSWKVTLDWDQDFRGDLPMLVASEEHFDVSYSGTGGVVSIVEEQKGFIGQEVCTSHCMHEVSGLSPSTEYHFRVRAINGAGVGPFSGVSEPIRTHRLGPPLRTSTLLISSVGTDFIVVQVPIPDANGVDPSELVIELQFRPILAVSQPVPVAWTTLPPARVLYDNERVVTITANGLRPLTQYELRARAISPLGEGQWSHATMAVKTRPNPPPPPQVFTPTKSDVHDREVTIHWSADMPVFRDGLYRPFDIATEQPPIESFDIEYRVSGDRRLKVFQALLGGWKVLLFLFEKFRRLCFDQSRELLFLEALVQAELSSLEGLGKVQVRRRGPDAQGGYTYEVTFDWDRPPSLFRGDFALLYAEAFTLQATWPREEGGPVFVREVRKGRIGGYVDAQSSDSTPRTSPEEKLRFHPQDELVSDAAVPFNFTVTQLNPITLYQFRVRAVSALGAGPWSTPTDRVRTSSPELPTLDSFPPFNASSGLGFGLDGVGREVKERLPESLSTTKGDGFQEFLNYLSPLQGHALIVAKSQGARILGGKGSTPGLGLGEPDYLSGVAMGGAPGQDGGPGLVVVRYYVHNQPTPSVSTFVYQDPAVFGPEPQLYVVPKSPVAGIVTSHVDIKAWGAGGGGGATDKGVGGAGAF